MSIELPIAAPAPAEDARPLPRWASFVLTREPATAQALFRIAVGLCVIGSLGSVVWHGAVTAVWMPIDAGGYHPPDGSWPFDLIGGLSPAKIRLMLGMTIAAGGALAAGLGGRPIAMLTLAGYMGVTRLNPDACGSFDPLMTNALWLVVLGGGHATLSADCRLRTGRWTSSETVYAWPRWLALIQIVLVYFNTGIQKVSDTWVPGGDMSAVYYILQQPTWQRADSYWIAHVFPLFQFFTLGTWFFEVGSPLLLLGVWLERHGKGRVARWLRRFPFRRVWAAGGTSLHLGIALFMAVGIFPYIAPAFYFALLAPAPADGAEAT